MPVEDKVHVSGKPVSSNKSLWKKVYETFAVNNIKDARDYIVSDVIIPGFFDLLYDGATRGLARLIYGENGAKAKRLAASNQKDYSTRIKRLSDGESFRNRDLRNVDNRVVSISDYNEIELATRAQAEQLLDDMCEFLDNHECITVAKMYEFARYKGGEITDNDWGWTTLRGADIVRSGGGWTLVLPRAIAIKDIK